MTGSQREANAGSQGAAMTVQWTPASELCGTGARPSRVQPVGRHAGVWGPLRDPGRAWQVITGHAGHVGCCSEYRLRWGPPGAFKQKSDGNLVSIVNALLWPVGGELDHRKAWECRGGNMTPYSVAQGCTLKNWMAS